MTVATKRLATVFLLIFGLAASGAVPASHAASPPALSERIKQGLMELEPLRGDPVDRAYLDGKPLLVVFWASW